MPPSPRPTRETLLFWGLLALHLLPIWIFPFLPTQDGPGHQAVAFILRQYDHPAAGLLRQYYLPNQEALPNWFIFFLMGRVLGFVSVPVAEKILLTAYVLLLPLAARYALRAIDPGPGSSPCSPSRSSTTSCSIWGSSTSASAWPLSSSPSGIG